MPKIKDIPEGAGHRQRLRKRFLQSGLDGFLDYEIVEVLLTLGTPRKDCKQIAKAAIKKFGNMRNVLDASYEELQQIEGIGSNNAFGVKLFQEVAAEYDKRKVSDRVSFKSPKFVADYLRRKIGNKKKEYFVILFLDNHNNLVSKEVSIGVLDEVLVHPREVFKEAIQASAVQVVIAHNHPSDVLEPSENDINTTQSLVKAGYILDIEVIDHIIFNSGDFLSLRKVHPMLFVET